MGIRSESEFNKQYISVFSGAGGLDLAIRLAVPGARCVCHVEIEAAAAAILASRMEEGSLDAAPIWSDARTFHGRPWRGRVGGIIAGFPCPDYSVAGRRAGITGKHGQLWHPLARIIREVGPSWIFLENVPGILNPHRNKETKEIDCPAGIDFVLGDLAEMGFDAEWGCVSAAAVGASHKRERWWCLAYSPCGGLGELRERSGRDGLADGGKQTVDDATGARCEWWEPVESAASRHETWLCESCGRRDPVVNAQCSERRPHPDGAGCAQSRDDGEGQAPGGAGERGETVGDTLGAGLEEWRCERGDDGAECAAVERAGVPFFAPGPSDPRWADLLVRFPWLRPALAQAEAQSAIHSDFDGMAQMVADTRTDALRAAGNGAVALAGAAALRELLIRVKGIKNDGSRED